MQLRTLRFVAAWWLAHKAAPRSKDIAWHLNKSETTARYHADWLISKGMLYRIPGKKFSLMVTGKGDKAIAEASAATRSSNRKGKRK
tara:strand:+ start:178 stop:438 length:261 start_codon:yes stop_codon:yes gene_type:complete